MSAKKPHCGWAANGWLTIVPPQSEQGGKIPCPCSTIGLSLLAHHATTIVTRVEGVHKNETI
jgi:hypothetical protein